jgi:hypothetical protein
MILMKLRYETGVAVMIQFLAMVFLNFVDNAVVGSFQSCHDATTTYDCVSGIGINVLYVILLAGWFGFVWVLAYAAQDKRDPKLANLLIGAEALILVVALFNAKHYPNLLGLITSLVDAAFAVWIIYLAFQLRKAKGGRITASAAKGRPRQRASAKK